MQVVHLHDRVFLLCLFRNPKARSQASTLDRTFTLTRMTGISGWRQTCEDVRVVGLHNRHHALPSLLVSRILYTLCGMVQGASAFFVKCAVLSEQMSELPLPAVRRCLRAQNGRSILDGLYINAVKNGFKKGLYVRIYSAKGLNYVHLRGCGYNREGKTDAGIKFLLNNPIR